MTKKKKGKNASNISINNSIWIPTVAQHSNEKGNLPKKNVILFLTPKGKKEKVKKKMVHPLLATYSISSRLPLKTFCIANIESKASVLVELLHNSQFEIVYSSLFHSISNYCCGRRSISCEKYAYKYIHINIVNTLLIKESVEKSIELGPLLYYILDVIYDLQCTSR